AKMGVRRERRERCIVVVARDRREPIDERRHEDVAETNRFEHRHLGRLGAALAARGTCKMQLFGHGTTSIASSATRTSPGPASDTPYSTTRALSFTSSVISKDLKSLESGASGV